MTTRQKKTINIIFLLSLIYIPLAVISSTIIDYHSTHFDFKRIPFYLITHIVFWGVFYLVWRKSRRWFLYSFGISIAFWIILETVFWLLEVSQGLDRTSPAPVDSFFNGFISLSPPGIFFLGIGWGMIYFYPWLITVFITNQVKNNIVD